MEQDQRNPESLKSGQNLSNDSFSYPNISEILIPYFSKLWANRRNIVIANSAVFILTVVYQLVFVKPYFESPITIYPDYGNKSGGGSGIAAVAALAGISVGDASSPIEVYQDLLESETVIEKAVYAKYKTRQFKDSVNLIEYFEIDGDNDLPPEENKRKMFVKVYTKLTTSVIFTSIEPLTKILNVKTRLSEPQLSADVVNNLVKSLDEYVRTKRKSNAATQRSYIETRISQISDSLETAENRLMYFQQSNRTISSSPNLLVEQSRLNRLIMIYQGVYAELARQLEIAKIDEIRDAPIINIGGWAKDPVIKAGPKRALMTIIVIVISLFLSSLYVLAFEPLQLFVKRIIGIQSK